LSISYTFTPFVTTKQRYTILREYKLRGLTICGEGRFDKSGMYDWSASATKANSFSKSKCLLGSSKLLLGNRSYYGEIIYTIFAYTNKKENK
jgi:hypothetical protein